MVMAALSPGSILATPIQANPQVRADLQTSQPQASQDAEKTAKSTQTDTVTISAQAIKMADDKNAKAEEASNKADEQESLQLARDKADNERSEIQRNAVKAYASPF
ncbi:MAG: hypothetical protein PHN84_03210 [Desulfuromonadaceae bacterium]|nr:hypothetical protein [Desulfuromonadaceae bacterium]MDD2854683.1 hypothetical protein [Desulfuromonadaceae bacterium]